MQAPAFGSFGSSVEEAGNTEFFAWFHFVEERREPAGEGSTMIRYRPFGDRFHSLVTCDLFSDRGGRLERIDLSIDGGFIDDPGIGTFARDIAKSFLGDAITTEADVEQVRDVIMDLRFRQQAGAQHDRGGGTSDPDEMFTALTDALAHGEEVIAVRGNPDDPFPELPPVVSRGFAVYAGERDEFSRPLSCGQLTIRNVPGGGGRTVVITLARE